MGASGGDSWWHPRSDKLETVGVPGEAPGLNPSGQPFTNPCYCDVGIHNPHEWAGTCEKGQRPTTQHEAAASTKFVYFEGQVGFGDEWWEIARILTEEAGLTYTQQGYVSNLIARNALPHDFNIAVGTMRNGKPQIWAANVDRNAVWDAAVDTWKSEYPEDNGYDDFPAFNKSEWL